jgi:hypothetical protein
MFVKVTLVGDRGINSLSLQTDLDFETSLATNMVYVSTSTARGVISTLWIFHDLLATAELENC